MQHHSLIRAFSFAGLFAFAGMFTSCTNPVRDKAIERLGGEPGDVPQGELHRPGQPCVVCHSDGGPASDSKFAVAGTIFVSADPNAKGAEGVKVLFIDASSATREATTNEAGNFFITEAEWPDLTYPFKVGISKGASNIPMRSTVNREPSCAFCHQPNPGSDRSLPGDDPRSSIGQIVGGGP